MYLLIHLKITYFPPKISEKSSILLYFSRPSAAVRHSSERKGGPAPGLWLESRRPLVPFQRWTGFLEAIPHSTGRSSLKATAVESETASVTPAQRV